MKGTPYIYQGDELGMTNNGGFRQLSDYRDLESINWFHAYTRAGLTTEAEMFAAWAHAAGSCAHADAVGCVAKCWFYHG